MSMDYIRRTYNVPAKRGARVQYDGVTLGQPPLLGTITGTKGALLRVRFDGARRTHNLHPTWALVYLKTPNVVIEPPKVGSNDGLGPVVEVGATCGNTGLGLLGRLARA